MDFFFFFPLEPGNNNSGRFSPIPYKERGRENAALTNGVATKRSGDFLPLSAAFMEIRSPAERLINSLLRLKVEHGQFPQTQTRVHETVA